MVGESSVPAILGVAARHVACHAITVLRGVMRRQSRSVTRKAPRTVGLDCRSQRFMRVVAGSAPQASAAVPSAAASSQLLNMADDFEIRRRCAGRQGVTIDVVSIFESFAGHEVRKLLAGICNPHNAEQMALLANAVTCCGLEFSRIDDGSRLRVGQVSFHRAVAAFAGNPFGCEHGIPVLIERAGDMQGRSGMAQQAFFTDRPRKSGSGWRS